MNAPLVLTKPQDYLMGVGSALGLLQVVRLRQTPEFMIRITLLLTRLLGVVLKSDGQLTGIEIVLSEKYEQ
jgi:hypothetical protein